MEEAYSELYQEFLRLRSLCLRQAALLHQLATALQKQQGAALPNGEASDMMSIPVQCTQEIPACLLEYPQPLTATAHNAAAQCCVADRLSRNVGTFSDLLAEDMSKLCMEGPRRTKMPGTDRPSLPNDLRTLSDGMLMSDVALQSNVCEFCQAVFPGDTTTRGEFLRHLYTHIT
ncbi:uncharacterized protein LOC115583378 isoform X2 [Sparus aurata]|uniref:uncharacterized protein LOC115583378 isoform X2 n=1 Tax=Sparus aurata TaxID=8175 RepID=UPI0011C13F7C|nr:uncharacterized protein LOC115583378 isoform X2 [Sparus aurata]